MNLPMSSFTRSFRRTLRTAHLRLACPPGRSSEENLRSIEDAITKVHSIIAPVFPEEAKSGILIIGERAVVAEPPPPARSTEPAMILQEINGCKSLLLEIVRRAAYDWVLYRTSRRLLHSKLAEHAFHWLFVEKAHDGTWNERLEGGKYITSFLAICEALELDPESVRTHVRKLTPKNVMSVGRPAEYRRRDACPPAPEEATLSVVLPEGIGEVDDPYDD